MSIYNPLSSNGIGVVTVVWWALFPVVWYPICCTRITEATRLRYFSTERRLNGDGPFHPWNISWGMCNPMYRTGSSPSIRSQRGSLGSRNFTFKGWFIMVYHCFTPNRLLISHRNMCSLLATPNRLCPSGDLMLHSGRICWRPLRTKLGGFSRFLDVIFNPVSDDDTHWSTKCKSVPPDYPHDNPI